ncbi:2-keto-4-pentenoate hydratase/2-oxohepta-3-ene-1,7-dioic acid hydratase in catechol pathway [Kineosphaera limosa]|uniref:Fumarylacetoacetate hydrolase family protein n=1 Tax=Kineosphaera limosa NBRC 100340 TaxID=1184609 RepID=K6WUR0_9MICO|nr:fumarylacetoacetate hydrolase family protein [Kineosphaera limosa]NYE01179.1 2-keto-4-pentenoate hydratase/2-oxohepta-3-ene-1,7-dioic acid hydratase in catechol pathway [Kineosphaera limosa]GAB97586.1 fumarylacetoacetate hydrolase family protein [Kineosphaera limosa NBRC 100340]
MKLARLGPLGAEVPVVERDGRWVDARPVTADFGPTFFADNGLQRLAAALSDLPDVDRPAGERVGAPIARPGAVVCIGMNYAAHAAESGAAPPAQPVVFLKVPNTVGGPFDEVAIPRGSNKTDWEVELGVVVGRTASYLSSPQEALAHVAGYVTVNDLSERAFQLEVSGGQWSKGKCCAGFTPVGPWFVTADCVDAAGLTLRSWVNGEPRQESSTADMIFDVATLVHDLSQYLVLEPGDLILTGTPQGVALSGRFPYLRAGDHVEVEVEGLGRSRQHFV